MGGRNPLYTETFKDRFKLLWLSGLSTSLMGSELNITKNAVVGLRKRWDLPGREDPIKDTDRKKSEAAKRRSDHLAAAAVAKADRAARPLSTRVLDRPQWLEWFSRQTLTRRRSMALAEHATSCPLSLGIGGLWQCDCGASQPQRTRGLSSDPALPEPLPPAKQDPMVEPPPPADQPVAAVAPAKPERVVPGCCFPFGNPGTSSFRFCDEPVSSRRSPYCDACAKLAFVKLPRDKPADHALGG